MWFKRILLAIFLIIVGAFLHYLSTISYQLYSDAPYDRVPNFHLDEENYTYEILGEDNVYTIKATTGDAVRGYGPIVSSNIDLEPFIGMYVLIAGFPMAGRQLCSDGTVCREYDVDGFHVETIVILD